MRSPTSSSRAGRQRAPSAFVELDLVDAVVAAHEHEHEPAAGVRPVAALDDDRERLQQRARGHAEHPRDVVDRRRSGRMGELRRRQRRGQLDGLRIGARDLDVGGVAGRERDLVLACGARRHVLVRAGAAHHPDVGLDAVPLQPAALEDPVVGLEEANVARPQAILVAVEAVGVLHDELARAQHAGPRARLVTLLDLEVVEQQRQVAIGAHDLRDVRRDAFLVRHREDHVGALAVLELEQLVDLVAPRPAPRLGGLQDRHQHLLGADRVDLLAHDPRRPSGARASPRAATSTGPRRAGARARRAPSACATAPRRRPVARVRSAAAGVRGGSRVRHPVAPKPTRVESEATAPNRGEQPNGL